MAMARRTLSSGEGNSAFVGSVEHHGRARRKDHDKLAAGDLILSRRRWCQRCRGCRAWRRRRSWWWLRRVRQSGRLQPAEQSSALRARLSPFAGDATPASSRAFNLQTPQRPPSVP